MGVRFRLRFISVHNILGSDLLKSAYEGALVIELAHAGVPFERQKMYLSYIGEDLMNTVKKQKIKIIKEQPEDSSYNEILHELNFSAMVNNGLRDSLEDTVISTEELKKDVEKW